MCAHAGLHSPPPPPHTPSPFSPNLCVHGDRFLYVLILGFVCCRGKEALTNLVDLAVLVLRYSYDGRCVSSIPIPTSCALASGSQIQSIVNCSGFLEPGQYAILPLAFNHWDLSSIAKPITRGQTTRSGGVKGSKPYVVALYSAKAIQYQSNVTTRPGFLAESIFLLASKAHAKSKVSLWFGCGDNYYRSFSLHLAISRNVFT